MSALHPLVLAMLLFPSLALANTAEKLQGVSGTYARIIEEVMPQIGKSPAEAEENRRKAAFERLQQSAHSSPKEVRLYHLFFNHPQTEDDLLSIVDRFLFIDRITFKQYEPAQDIVWTTTINDFEVYKGTAEERLTYLVARQSAQRRAIAQNSSSIDGAAPPEEFEFSVFEITAYARNDQMSYLAEERGASLLHVNEIARPMSWDRIDSMLRTAERQDLPSIRP